MKHIPYLFIASLVVAPAVQPTNEANTNWLVFIFLGGALSMLLIF